MSAETSKCKQHNHAPDECVKEQFELLVEVLNHISEGVAITDKANHILFVNPAFTEITGYTEDDVKGKNPNILSSGLQDRDFYIHMWEEIREKDYWQGEVVNRHKQGELYPEELTVRAIRDYDGEVNWYVGIFSDLTERNHIEGNKRLYSRVFNSSSEGIMITDKNKVILSVNPAFTNTTGYTAKEAIGRTTSLLHSGAQNEQFYMDMNSAIDKHGNWKGEIWNRRKNGEVYPEWLNIDAIKDDKQVVTNYVGIFNDITDRKKSEDQLKYLAHYDMLTSLPNRMLFYDRLEQAVIRARRREQMIAVFFIDLNRFKVINDTLGHSVGDQLLIQVANRLKTSLRECDTVARLGGDEFVILLTDISDSREVITVAQKVTSCFNEAFVHEEHEFFISGSVGISLYPDDGKDLETLIKNADIAMYRAKETKKDYQFYTSEIAELNTLKMQMEGYLRKALINSELIIYYQPQVEIDSGKIVGLEALLRWQHPDKGLLLPAEFISLAEETGLIISVGEWVLRRVCEQMVLWRESDYPQINVSVNLSPYQLMDHAFISILTDAIQCSGIDPGYLTLEITENISMNNIEYILEKVERIKDLGVLISIDDFGTGHSSLSYLKKYQPNTLKIDQSFIRNINLDKHNAVIVKSIIDLALGLELTVIAEGVETEEELEMLKGFRCNIIQGYLIAKPLPIMEVEMWFNR